MEFLKNQYFLIFITFALFFGAKLLQKRSGWVVLNPILVTIAMLILFLSVTGIPYSDYEKGGMMIDFWLKPAVVALGVPMYLQLEQIKKQLIPIFLTAAVVVCVGLLGAVFGFKVLMVGKVKSPIAQGLSMGTASHAVGTSAAMERSQKYGAYASLGLTLNGILTAIITPYLLPLLGIGG